MSTDNDPLEGFRELPPDELEAGLRRNLGDHDFLVDIWQMGEAMNAYVETPAGSLLVNEFRDEFNENLEKLLEHADLDSPAARQHFYELRACWKLLAKIRTTVEEGRKARRTIVESDSEPQVTP